MRLTRWILIGALTALAGCGGPPRGGSARDDAHDSSEHMEHAVHGDAEAEEAPMSPEEERAFLAANDDWATAVATLAEQVLLVEGALASDDPHAAHGPLDRSDLLLEQMPGLAQRAGVPRSQWMSIGVAIQRIRDALTEIHENLDAERPHGYERLRPSIDAALAAIRAVPVPEQESR